MFNDAKIVIYFLITKQISNKFANIKERILYLLEQKGVAKDKFFIKIGMTYGNFTGKAKETPLNSTAIGNILLEFPDVSPDWLLTGQGSMLRVSEGTVGGVPAAVPAVDEAYKDKYISVLEAENKRLRAENDRQSEIIQGFMNGTLTIDKKK